MEGAADAERSCRSFSVTSKQPLQASILLTAAALANTWMTTVQLEAVCFEEGQCGTEGYLVFAEVHSLRCSRVGT
jgi:hypothetical protein